MGAITRRLSRAFAPRSPGEHLQRLRHFAGAILLVGSTCHACDTGALLTISDVYRRSSEHPCKERATCGSSNSILDFNARAYLRCSFASQRGPVNGWLEALGLERRVFLNTPGIVFAGLVYTALPFMVLPLYAAIERADRNVINAARDLGANPFQVFHSICSSCTGRSHRGLHARVRSLSESVSRSYFARGGKANMIANVIENQFNESQNWPLGSAISVFLVVFSLIGTWWSVRFDEETN